MNGVEIAGMNRPEVVQMLRDSKDSVTLLVSRQEVVEEQEEQDNVCSYNIVCSLSPSPSPRSSPGPSLVLT